MNLGIFGDSYADTNSDTDNKTWPNLCKQDFAYSHIEGRCGVSHWYTYERFLKQIKKHKFTHVIFCHTATHRWPCLPKELEGSNWNIHSLSNASYSENLGVLNKFYLDLFPNTLTDFISQNIFRSINEYCKENSIYLINIINFRQGIYKYKTEFPVLYDIDSISHKEIINYKGKSYTFTELINQFPMPDGDPRICHFGHLNNARLADILKNLLTTQPYNITHDMRKDFTWDVYDEGNDLLFQKTLEQER